MALGDVVADLSSVAASGGVLDIRPPSGSEWIIHNIYYDQGSIEYYKADGTNELLFDQDSSSGGRLGIQIHCTNGQWVRLKNMGSASVLIAYDGVQTK